MLSESDILLYNPKFLKLANGGVKNMPKLANNFSKNMLKLANGAVEDLAVGTLEI